MVAFCGIDVGTQGTKAGIYREDGTCAGQGYAEHAFDHLQPGWVEMDPDQIVNAVLAAVAQAVAAARPTVAAADIEAISLSGIMCGPVFIDEQWRPVRPLIPYLDLRATAEVAWLANDVEPLWVNESANATLDTYVMPAVLEWVRRNEPSVYARIRKVLSLAPYVGGCLAGLKAADAYTDPSHLSGWILGWNAATGRPSPRQLDALGIPVDFAPDVHASWDIVGTITSEMAARCGLAPGTPIAAGAGDVMQSNLAAGLTRPGIAVDVAGTASILTVGVTGPSPAVTALPGMLYSLGTIPGQAVYWGYVKAGGMSLRWLRDRVLGRDGDDSLYSEADALAHVEPPGSGGVLFLPYLSGGNPDNPDASGGFLGMTADADLGTMWRSMLESIAFEYADFLDAFAANGIPVDDVIAVGGGASSGVWNQIKADVVGLPWRVPSRQDGAILANAVVAARAIGAVDDIAATIGAWVGTGSSSAVNADHHRAYRTVRAARRSVLTGPLREVFSTLAPLRSAPEKP